MNDQKNTIIESIGTYFPSRSVTTQEVLSNCETPIKFPLEKITGIEERRMGGEQEFSIDLSIKAIESCLLNSRYRPEDIDVLICCNISRYDGYNKTSFEPSTSVKMKKYFGMSNAIVFDISNACAGMFTGIYILDSLLKSGIVKRGMVVSGEYITHLTNVAQREIENFMDDRMACLTVGDAGAAVILQLGSDSNVGFQNLEIQTLGRYSPFCIAKEAKSGGWVMHTDSVSLTDAAMRTSIDHSLKMLADTNWNPEGCDHLIMHQTSRMTLNGARQEINKRLGEEVFNSNNTINNLERRGNTASTSHMVALLDNIRNGKIKDGDKLVFSVAASGLTVGTGLYQVDDLPTRLLDYELDRGEEPVLESFSTNRKKQISIQSIGVVSPESEGTKDSLELLEEAARNCLKLSSYQPADIDLLIYVGVYRTDYVMEPAYAALLAGKLEMNANVVSTEHGKTLAFDLFNGAVGFMNAMYVAQGMISSGKSKRVMVVASEIENNKSLKGTELIGVRETGSAMILEAGEIDGQGISDFSFSYDINSQDYYAVYSKFEFPENKGMQLHFEKNANFDNELADLICKTVNEYLNKEGLNITDFSKVFLPQISSQFINVVCERLEIKQSQVVDICTDKKDVFTSSLPYSLKGFINTTAAKKGDKGLLISAGSGLQVGCAIYNF